eukprot:2834792-Prymnesium_polylepis.1
MPIPRTQYHSHFKAIRGGVSKRESLANTQVRGKARTQAAKPATGPNFFCAQSLATRTGLALASVSSCRVRTAEIPMTTPPRARMQMAAPSA